jgi:hypothetical protein
MALSNYSLDNSVVQEFGAGVRIRPDFANPAKFRQRNPAIFLTAL